MDYTDFISTLVDKAQALYELLVKAFGHILDWFAFVKELVVDLVCYVKQKLSTEKEIDAFFKNYIDNEHIFI